jgi:hypothetical protein
MDRQFLFWSWGSVLPLYYSLGSFLQTCYQLMP